MTGKIYTQLQLYDMAASAFEKARDLDGIPFRAMSTLNRLLAGICRKEKVPLVDSIASFRMHAQEQLIGHDLIVDNVHPSLDGAFLVASGFCRALEKPFAAKIPGGFQWPETWMAPVELLGMTRAMKADYYLYLARYTAQLAALTRAKEARLKTAREYLVQAGKFGASRDRIAKMAGYLALLEEDTTRAIREEYRAPGHEQK
jgi:tetratricopeptide (TPR) repeat protein